MLTDEMTTKNRTADSTALTLVEPTIDLALEFTAMVYEFLCENSIFFAEPIRDLRAYVQRARDYALGRNLPPGWVPSSEYWLLRDGWLVVGKSSLRHRLNDNLARRGGHIGYCVRPSQRRKGYGALILQLTLEKARQLGLDRVLVTCATDNLASARIIQASGGTLEDQVTCKDSGEPVSRYCIDLATTT